jgi:hypothetical protein
MSHGEGGATVAMGRGLSQQSRVLIRAAHNILSEIEPASVRAVCYKLFTQERISSMSKNETNKVSRLLRIAREEDFIPWEWIVDETCEAERPGTWKDPEHFARVAMNSFRRDRWQQQDTHVEVWSEKGTIRGTITPVLREMGVTFRSFGGYVSATVANEIATLSRQIEKPFVALYVGDWDPSGLHMSDKDLPRRLDEYGGEVFVRRIALEAEDLEYLPSFPLDSKAKDPRVNWFNSVSVPEHGSRCWELDAMDPRDLRERVEADILAYIDRDAWDRCQLAEEAEQESLRMVLTNWQTQCAVN